MPTQTSVAHPLLLPVVKIKQIKITIYNKHSIEEDIMKKATLIISLTLVLALIAGTVFAWGPGRGRHMWNQGNGGQYCQGFNSGSSFSDLSKEQKDQLTALEQQYVDDTYEMRSAQFATRQQIRLLMQTSSPDRAKLNSLYDEIDAIQKQLREKRVDFILEAKKIAPDFEFGRGSGFGKGRSNAGNGQGGCRGGGYGPGNCFN
jgi:zinc resistance-associated protein